MITLAVSESDTQITLAYSIDVLLSPTIFPDIFCPQRDDVDTIVKKSKKITL